MKMAEEAGQFSVPKLTGDCLVSKGLEVGDLLRVRKEALLYVRPCASERGKLMADLELTKDSDSQFIDPKALCSLLEIHRRRFSEMKCSEKLGVAKLKWGGKEISIFKNGKLKVQQAMDREEILRVAGSISRLAWGAAICGVCGRPAIECASGECGKCTAGERVSVRLAELPNSELLQQAYVGLEKSKFSGAADPASELRKARYLALHFVMDAPGRGEAALGLALLGEASLAEARLKSKK